MHLIEEVMWELDLLRKTRGSLEICMIATKRSGHHAFLEWVLQNRKGRYAYLNHINPRSPNLRAATFVSNSVRLQENFAHRKRHTTVLSYENQSLEQITGSEAFKSRDKILGKPHRRVTILLMRDPLNTLASAVQVVRSGKHVVTDADHWIGRLVQSWVNHAKEYLGYTSILSRSQIPSEVMLVSYNKYLRDELYRNDLSLVLDMTSTDGLNKLSHFAKGGNTFFSDKMSYSPDISRLESRWEIVKDDPLFLKFLLDNELQELAKQFYARLETNELAAALEILTHNAKATYG